MDAGLESVDGFADPQGEPSLVGTIIIPYGGGGLVVAALGWCCLIGGRFGLGFGGQFHDFWRLDDGGRTWPLG